MGKFIDKTGRTYGSLTVLRQGTTKNGRIYWYCRCICGKELDIRGDKLTDNYVDDKGNPSCGCLRLQHVKESVIKVKPGDVYGRLVVIEDSGERSSNGGILWRCLCDCGNYTNVTSEMLLRKERPTRSCGCLQKEKARENIMTLIERKRMKPNTYENGFFIKEVEVREGTNNGQNESWAFAVCPYCGTEKWIPCIYIRNGDTKSCGCLGRSAGEAKIKQLLDTANIPYETEKTFDDCVSNKQAKLRYDFFVQGKYLIEFDGPQHSDNKNSWWSTDLVKRDEIKNDYAKNKNIPLIRIPYTAYNSLTLQDLVPETSKYLI